MESIRLTPYIVLLIASFLTALLVSVALWLAIHQPSLGIQLKAMEHGHGLEITAVHRDGPSANILHAGDILMAISAPKASPIQLEAQDVIEDPDTFSTFVAYNQFLLRQQKLSDILHQPVVNLTLDDHQIVRVQPDSLRSIAYLPISFWIILLFGSISLMLGAGIWAVQKQSTAIRLLFGSSIGFLIGTCSVAIYSTRELAMSTDSIQMLSILNHVGNNLFAICSLGLLWHYPKPISRFPAILTITAITMIYMLNEQFQWYVVPGHVFYTLTIGMFIVAILFAVMQWVNTSNDLVNRAALKFFLLLTMSTMTATVMFFFVPAYLYGKSLISVASGYGIALLMYLGLVFGVLRYQLFDIDRWWFELWLWFFAGASVLAVDFVLSTSVQAAPRYSIAIALIAVGWLYFPVRQKLWERFVRRSSPSLDQYLPELITVLLKSEKADINQQWKKLLRDIFKPLHSKSVKLSCKHAHINRHGESMMLPTISGNESIEMFYADKGSRLFSKADARLADALRQILCRTKSQIEAQLSGALKERERIMRDLHDDVGGRLLTLAYANHDKHEPELAREALKSLREIIYSLDGRAEKSLDAAIAHWRAEIYERCMLAKIKLIWNWQDIDAGWQLNARQYLNLNRILYEAVSNALKHADANQVEISGTISGAGKAAILNIDIQNDGIRSDKNHRSGKGLINMQNRMHELDGHFSFKHDEQRGLFTVCVSIPLICT